jgi:SAM-dependent methyltransferase
MGAVVTERAAEQESRHALIDTTVAHPARRYNYWLGGKDNFAVDRASGDEIAETFPTIRVAAVENRRFLQRATRFLAEAGIRQFLDIGTGLPTADNTHEVAQAIAPESHVVYVDNDPMVMAHARALLTSTPEGRTAYIEDDLRRPEAILARRELHATLDLSKPVGLMLVAVLHFVHGEEPARQIVRTLLDALAPGSYLVVSTATWGNASAEDKAAYREQAAAGRADFWPRDRDEVAAFFDGLELVEPGIAYISEWRAENEPEPRPRPEEILVYGAVGRVP